MCCFSGSSRRCRIFQILGRGSTESRRFLSRFARAFAAQFAVLTTCSVQFAAAFHSSKPYPHVAIPDFFSPAVAAELAQQFPSPLASKKGWFLYNNPIEIKFANNDRPSLPACFNSAIDILNSEQTRQIVSAISGVPFLEEVHPLHNPSWQQQSDFT